MAYKYKLYKEKGGTMSSVNIKITSMKDVYELLLEQGYNVSINHDYSFISVVEEDFIVCGDDDLVTLQGKKDLFSTSSHVISDDQHVYEKVYEIFKHYIEYADQYISKKIFNLL